MSERRLSEAPVYRIGDRDEKLGPPPWKPDDPKLIAWEKAHGHDCRLRCSDEWCALVIARSERCVEFAEWLLTLDEPGSEERRTVTLTKIIDRAREALDV